MKKALILLFLLVFLAFVSAELVEVSVDDFEDSDYSGKWLLAVENTASTTVGEEKDGFLFMYAHSSSGGSGFGKTSFQSVQSFSMQELPIKIVFESKNETIKSGCNEPCTLGTSMLIQLTDGTTPTEILADYANSQQSPNYNGLNTLIISKNDETSIEIKLNDVVKKTISLDYSDFFLKFNTEASSVDIEGNSYALSELKVFDVNRLVEAPELESLAIDKNLFNAEESMQITAGVVNNGLEEVSLFCSEDSLPLAENALCSSNNFNEGAMNCSVTLVEDGNHELYCRAFNGLVFSETKSVSFLVDGTPPATSSTFNDANWLNQDTNVVFSCTDALSGCSKVFASIDSGEFSEASSLLVSSDGNHLVQFYSVDSAGNTEPTKSINVLIDKTAPATQTSFDFSQQYSSEVQPVFSCSDALNSCKVFINLNGTGFVETSSVIVGFGSHELCFYSIDAIGNQEQTQCKAIKVEQPVTPPVVNNSPPPSGGVNNTGSGPSSSSSFNKKNTKEATKSADDLNSLPAGSQEQPKNEGNSSGNESSSQNAGNAPDTPAVDNTGSQDISSQTIADVNASVTEKTKKEEPSSDLLPSPFLIFTKDINFGEKPSDAIGMVSRLLLIILTFGVITVFIAMLSQKLDKQVETRNMKSSKASAKH